MNDYFDEDKRHQRLVKLMRMQGETNRLERRMHALWIIAAVLGVIALILGTL